MCVGWGRVLHFQFARQVYCTPVFGSERREGRGGRYIRGKQLYSYICISLVTLLFRSGQCGWWCHVEESVCAFVTLFLSRNQTNLVPVKPRFHDSSFLSTCCKTLLKMPKWMFPHLLHKRPLASFIFVLQTLLSSCQMLEISSGH